MKRSRLNRKTPLARGNKPLKRGPIGKNPTTFAKPSKPLRRSSKKREAKRKEAAPVLDAWADSLIQRCFACGVKAKGESVQLQRHHIANGKLSRDDDCRNIVLLCFQMREGAPRCHDLAELHRIPKRGGGYWPTLTRGACLALKRECDPDNYDESYLREQLKWGWQDLEPLPVELLAERQRNGWAA